MTPEQFKNLLKTKQNELKQAYARTLPIKVGTEAVNFFRDNIRKEGFVDSKLEKWKPAKRKSNPRHPERAYGTLLSRRSVLYRSINKRTSPGKVTIYSDVPYAAVHNEGLRANVSRFAAYKAYHATQQVRGEVKKDGDMDRARKVLHTFNRYQAAEYNTTVSRCRTAKQFEEFSAPDNMRLFPNLRWLPSRSATPRELHMEFYNRVWAKDDPFWAQNQPGNLWNCKCDWEETADPVTDGNPTAPVRHDGLEGNPAHTGEVFTDNCAYVKHSGKNRKERDKVEMKCRLMNKETTIKKSKDNLIDEITEINLNNTKAEVIYTAKGLKHAANDMGDEKGMAYWLKNEILPNIDKHLKKAKCMGRKISDPNHNTNKETVKLKKNSDYFYYLETTLPDGQKCCLHLGHYKTTYHVPEKAGKYYIYSITTYTPKKLESI